MIQTVLRQRAERYVHLLAAEVGNRRVGSPGNRQATKFFADTVAGLGWQIARQPFDCIDWVGDGACLALADGSAVFSVQPSPYSLGCQVQGPLVLVSTEEELVAAELRGAVVLVRGELAGEQLMPKHFPFFNPATHQRIITLLEEKEPLAIVAATERNPEMAGAVYPFSLIEDGDFHIPSVYTTDEEGLRLAAHAGATVFLDSQARRIPAQGW
ncbi:MAG: hypothetical protein R3300_13300, partial [Candidatus Promineifilaceae bacterium]|nr:hypothetical protein [Candidatus Promineifilaceae bacterium]